MLGIMVFKISENIEFPLALTPIHGNLIPITTSGYCLFPPSGISFLFLIGTNSFLSFALFLFSFFFNHLSLSLSHTHSPKKNNLLSKLKRKGLVVFSQTLTLDKVLSSSSSSSHLSFTLSSNSYSSLFLSLSILPLFTLMLLFNLRMTSQTFMHMNF